MSATNTAKPATTRAAALVAHWLASAAPRAVVETVERTYANATLAELLKESRTVAQAAAAVEEWGETVALPSLAIDTTLAALDRLNLYLGTLERLIDKRLPWDAGHTLRHGVK